MQKCIMLNWNDFEIIVAIRETKTLSAAARHLGLNQSTISRILKRIETDLGKQIFSTTSGYYEITPDGEPYLLVGKEMSNAVSSLQQSMPATSIQGTIRLTTIEALVEFLLSHISGFQREFPQIAIELNGSNQNVNLPQRSYHAALRLGRETKTKSMLMKKVGEIGISAYKKYNDQTASTHWIGYEASLSSIPEERWLRANTKTTKPRLHVSSYLTMESAIEQGLGIGLLPQFMGDRNQKLQRATGPKILLEREVWFISHPESRRDPAMECFSTWLFKLFEKNRSLFSLRG